MADKQYSNIKELRRAYSLTQDEMSYFIGMSVRTYREKESGKIPFSQMDIMKMILIFDLDPDDVYKLFYIKGTDASFWKNELLNKKRQEIFKYENLKKYKVK